MIFLLVSSGEFQKSSAEVTDSIFELSVARRFTANLGGSANAPLPQDVHPAAFWVFCQVLWVKPSRERKHVSICQTLKPAIGYSCFCSYAVREQEQTKENVVTYVSACIAKCVSVAGGGATYVCCYQELSPWGKALPEATDVNLSCWHIQVKAILDSWEARCPKSSANVSVCVCVVGEVAGGGGNLVCVCECFFGMYKLRSQKWSSLCILNTSYMFTCESEAPCERRIRMTSPCLHACKSNTSYHMAGVRILFPGCI